MYCSLHEGSAANCSARQVEKTGASHLNPQHDQQAKMATKSQIQHPQNTDTGNGPSLHILSLHLN
jgi:hypothetical protein